MGDISKTFRFSASHRLIGLREDHKCMRLHGHNWEVTLMLSGEPDWRGMVLDYGELAQFGDWLDANLDHRHLGAGDVHDKDGTLTDPAVLTFNPTAENLAAYLLNIAKDMFGYQVTVTVRETPSTSATVTAP